MIPKNYKCTGCKAHGVKLWRQYQTFLERIELLCGTCAAKDQKKPINLAESDQCGWLVPAIPDLQGSYWGYTSVPPEGVAWWSALPLAFTGEWAVKGGIERWITYDEWRKSPDMLDLSRVRRIVYSRDVREDSIVLVFFPTPEPKKSLFRRS